MAEGKRGPSGPPAPSDGRRFSRPELALVATAAAIVFTRVFAFSIVLPGFRAYGLTLTSNELLVGIALGAYGVTMALAQLVMGILSDRFGRQPILVIGTFVFVAGSIASAVAPSIGWLIAARLLQGLGGVSSAAMAAVGETVPASRRTMAMALIGIPAGVGFFLGVGMGSLLQDSASVPDLFWATAVLGLLAGIPFLLRPLPKPLPMPTPTSRGITTPMAALALAGFTINYAMSTVFFFLGSSLDVSTLAIVLVGALVVMGLASRAIDRRGATWQPVAACLALLAIGAAWWGLGANLAAAFAGGFLFFASHAVLSATLPSQVSRLAGRSGGRGHGMQLVSSYLGTAAGGAAAGALANQDLLAFVGLVTIAAASILLVLISRRPAQSADSSAVHPPSTPVGRT